MSARSIPSRSLHKILYVDDEKLSLKYFQDMAGEDFEVLTATSAEEGWAILEKQAGSIAVVVSDQRLGGMQGTTFLTQLREKHPMITRILATAFADVKTVVSAINDGAIYQYINKPWEPGALLQTLHAAMDSFLLRLERQQLLDEKAALMRDLIVSDRLAGYGMLAEGINHHLRNALVPVEVYLQLADANSNGRAMEESDPAFLEELRNDAHAQVKHITAMLGRLSSINKISAPRKEDPFSIEELWQTVFTQLEITIAEKGGMLSLTIERPMPRVECSRSRVTQVLRLMLEDQIERLDPGGEVMVSLCYREGGGDVVPHVHMEMSDNGPALDPSRLKSIFTPFFLWPDKPQHVGVNLATSYVALCSLGGWASVTNEKDRGTVIAYNIPIKAGGKTGKAPLEGLEQMLNS